MASPYKEPARELGAKERTFTSFPVGGKTFPIVVIFGLPGVALLSGFQSRRGEVFAGNRSVNIAIGVACIVGCIAIIVAMVRKSRLRIESFEHGLRWFEDGRTTDIFYRDVADIRARHTSRRSGPTRVDTSVYTVTLENRRKLLFTTMLRSSRELAARIELGIAENILPRVRQAFQANEGYAFGPLKLFVDRIEGKGKIMFWDAVGSVAIGHGVVTIHGKNKDEIVVGWSEIPNPNVLKTVVKERARLDEEAPLPP